MKKGLVTISLGIIYNSIVLSQPPSHDTVPLSLKLRAQGANATVAARVILGQKMWHFIIVTKSLLFHCTKLILAHTLNSVPLPD
jgi:hypothetical protein